MIETSIIPEELQTFDYYKNKLPLWLQQTFGFSEHFKIWYDLMMGVKIDVGNVSIDKTYYVLSDVDEVTTLDDFPFESEVDVKFYGDIIDSSITIDYNPFRISSAAPAEGAIKLTDGLQTIVLYVTIGAPPLYYGIIPASDCWLYLFDIYDKDYLKFINNLPDENYDVSDSKCDFLDKIGKLFCLNRHIKVTYDNAGVPTTEYLDLNNEEFLMLIKAQIIKNYWDGTLETLKLFYEDIGLYCHIYTNAAFSDTVEHPDEPTAKASFVLINPSHNSHSANVLKMFKAGLLRTESMGIMYEDTVVSSGTFGIWGPGEGAGDWDLGVWFI